MKKHKIIYYLSMLVFALVVAVGRGTEDEPRLADGRRVNRTRSTPSSRQEIYFPTFPLDRHPMGSVNCYRIKYARTDAETARFYAGLFGLHGEFSADEDGYTFENEKGKLTVYRHNQQLTYIPHSPPKQNPEEFLRTRGLPLHYVEVRMAFNGENHIVTFVDYIDNLKNYAFNHTFLLDKDGGIIQADYFYIEYDTLGTTRIKSMREAFGELPKDTEGPISLTRCRLVYYYENSVVQPAYFFEGEDSEGGTVEYFVKAAVYK
jgi:hypothetical protein